jgi:5-methylcytosine-specific restriction endonuclease McrA
MKKPALRSLSDKELLAQIEKIRRREHLSTIEILLHLNEVERRKLHLKFGYGSLFDYCVKHLRYSSSGAGRRVAVARCIRQHPEVLGLLRSQKLNVTGVSLVASVLTNDNKAELLRNIPDKTQSEIDAIAARYRPPIAMRDRVKPVRIRVPEPRTAARETSEEALQTLAKGACEKSNYSHNGSGHTVSACNTTSNDSANRQNIRTRQKLLVQFLADKAFMKKFEEVRALLSQRLSDPSFENVFEVLIEEFLERHSPTRRRTRRDKKASQLPRKRPFSPAREKPSRAAASHEAQPQPRSRHIPATVRDKVFARDKGRCTYVGKTGKRCGSTHTVQVDHITPFTRGGANTVSNLRLLCAKHNRLAAEEVFGESFAKRFRARE